MPVKVGIQIPLLKTLIGALNTSGVDGAKAMGAALYGEAEIIMSTAKYLTPVDTGALRSSGHVLAPTEHGRSITVGLVFGGTAAEYALIVHEDLTARHPVGQAKYLEQPALEAAPRIPDRLAAALDRALQKALKLA